jgi:hypothetical protein
VGGWNARDVLSNMEPTDAVYLTNWFPGTSSVVQRQGYSQQSTGLGAQVESIFSYAGGSTIKLFGVAGGKIYNCTAGGAVGAADVSGLSNSRFQYVNVATSGGNFMLCVNGADKLRGYTGSAWYADGDGTHDISGVDTRNVIGINLFKNRVWLIENNSLNAWYLPTSAIAGAAVAFPLQGVAKLGGYIMAMGTWTMDAGYGVDDQAVFITSRGEVIVYRGTDPANASTWALVGVWHLGSPIGRRCFVKFGGDLLLISQDGIAPMSTALQSDRLDQRALLTNKIQSAISEAVTDYGSNFGWQIIPFPKANQLYLNVPILEGNSQQQYVMNTITKSWCNFTGWNANCWELYNDNLYFGGNGFIGQAWNGYSDNGANIQTNGKQAFNYCGNPTSYKRWTLMRPMLLSNGIPTFACSIDVDFQDVDPSGSLPFAANSYAVWDASGASSQWDTAIWGGDLGIIRSWQGVTGMGDCCAPRLKTASSGIRVEWMNTELVMEQGGIL